jgi:hypothetical protein
MRKRLLPCEIHGDPRLLTPYNAALMGLYEILANAHEWQQVQEGEQIINKPRLNVLVLQFICQSEGLSFWEMFYHLSFIHKTIYDL